MRRGGLSFDDNPDFYSYKSQEQPEVSLSFKDLVQASPDAASGFFEALAEPDRTITSLYYFQNQTQTQIAEMLDISQVAVSRRLSSIIRRLKYILKRPKQNPVVVRRELSQLFPPHLCEAAYFFYFESAQNRVKQFLSISQSGASNKFKQVLEYLTKVSRAPDRGLDRGAKKRKLLALYYRDYFMNTKLRANAWTFVYKHRRLRRQEDLVFEQRDADVRLECLTQ